MVWTSIDAINGSRIHPDRPRDKMVARMQGVINQNYLEELAEKVSDALAMKVERGETVGPPPLGYRRNRDILSNGKIARVWTEPDPDVAPIVQLIFREYASGLYSLKSLARKLNADKVKKPRRSDIKPGRGSRHENSPLRTDV
jgi:DNA invertase Pin-like site-specific DNA recombinase